MARPRRAGFDERVGERLGVPLPVAQRLTGAARLRLPGPGYPLRAAAFLCATAPLGRRLLPHALRERAIRSLVGPMIETPSLKALYLGLERPRCGAPEHS